MRIPPMLPTTQTPATLDDLYKVEGKAELIGGRLVPFPSLGHCPAQLAFEIAISLHEYAEETRAGVAFAGGIAYALQPALPNGRQSFSPDASYYVGPAPENRMRFIERAPTFAVEVRSENDYGDVADAEREAKRADYFEAGTLVVWDVDPMAKTIAVYRGDPSTPAAVYGVGLVAEAEPAVPGWLLAVDELFE
jgi:Uma2 family endonuclease